MAKEELFDPSFDFGFSLVDEGTIKANEKFLEQAVTHTAELHASAEERFENLYRMIMPLLNNLKADPNKEYILWPDRVQKIDAFIKKIEVLRKNK